MLFLAIRHLLSRKKQTVLIFLGISLGTLMFTVISGMQLGMREFIEARLLSNTSHIQISARDNIIDRDEMTERFYGNQPVDWLVPPAGKREEAHIMYPQGWFDRLSNDPNVTGYSPSFTMNVIISHRESKYPSSLIGIIPTMYQQVMDLQKYVSEGRITDLSEGGNKVIIGVSMLKKLGSQIGDNILISSGLGELRPFKIVGTFSMGMEQIDDSLMFASLKDVQTLNKTPGQINGISVSLVNMERAHELASQWQLTSRDKVQSWEQANAQFLQIFDFQDYTRLAVTAAILIVAGFGIYNVLSIMISQKRKEIAILRSIGYPPKMIMELFLIQGIMLGVTGAIIGLGIGHLINMYLSTVSLGIGMGGDNTMTISYAPSIYIEGFLLAFISAILASFLPARAASKLTPLDIIRSDV
ncbi:MAG: ABC transporter permease [Gammaproteobacteria bacterium]|nr:ABC transporter permease [Gammaproteobacteria bacterium]